MLKLDDALAASHAVIVAAETESLNISVAVCDELGRLHAFLKMDGSIDVLSGHEAMRRAIRSAVTGKPSEIGGAEKIRSSLESEGIGGSSSLGGLPAYDGETFLGSIGVAGAGPEICVRLAGIGIEKLTNR
jgi:uncharacterized protein GlcG (DUF336 family)